MRGVASTLAILAPMIFGTSASGAPAVSDKDIKGKVICWDTGSRSEFHADGSLASTTYGKGSWAVTPTGLSLHGANRSAVWTVEKLSDTEVGLLDPDRGKYIKGHYCN
jgi:hypothetical protein